MYRNKYFKLNVNISNYADISYEYTDTSSATEMIQSSNIKCVAICSAMKNT